MSKQLYCLRLVGLDFGVATNVTVVSPYNFVKPKAYSLTVILLC